MYEFWCPYVIICIICIYLLCMHKHQIHTHINACVFCIWYNLIYSPRWTSVWASVRDTHTRGASVYNPGLRTPTLTIAHLKLEKKRLLLQTEARWTAEQMTWLWTEQPTSTSIELRLRCSAPRKIPTETLQTRYCYTSKLCNRMVLVT